jgi:N-acetylmuramoyl-L-alanine amidase
MKKGTVVLDAGHGGTTKVGGSSPNNATSPSGIQEKDITLDLARRTRLAVQKLASDGGHQVQVVLTRDQDMNLGLAERARVARQTDADLFLSIHCNASDAHNARGVETLVRGAEDGNANYDDDVAFATNVQSAVLLAIKNHDPATRDRRVKDQKLGVLNDVHLGERTRACLVEVEFIDRTDVDGLLNIGANAEAVRNDIAAALAKAVLDSLS